MLETERRKMTLTEADIESIREAMACHTCSFSADQVATLKSTADNLNSTQKIATRFIIYGLVVSVLGGMGFALKHIAVEIMATGKIPGK